MPVGEFPAREWIRNNSRATYALHGWSSTHLSEAQVILRSYGSNWHGSRQIHGKWATKGANSGDDKENSDFKSVINMTSVSAATVSLWQ